MIKVKGKMYGKIAMDVNEAVDALWQDADVLETIRTNDDEMQENIRKFLEALEAIKIGYCETLKQIEDGTIIEIDGLFDGLSFCVERSAVIYSLYMVFCDDISFLVRKHEDSVGLFRVYDTSYHGSPDYEYTLVYEGQIASDTYKAIKYLELHSDTYDNYIEEAIKLKQQVGNDVKSLTLIKK